MGWSPSITARYFSSSPSDPTSRWTPCPPVVSRQYAQLRFRLGCLRRFRLRARLGFSLSAYPGQRGVTPAFGYGAPYPGTSGTLTHLIWALPSTHYGPLRHPKAPGLSLTGVRLVILHHVKGLPVLRAFPLCTCCRHYPGTVIGDTALLIPPVLSAFPERVVGSACATSFSRIAQRSLTLRPVHSLDHLK